MLAPVSLSERIVSLDVLRGFAVLGILIMNIQSYSMISSAYLNPTAFGDLSGVNQWVWTLSHIFAEMKFMSIFSILFGAGVVLMTSRIESSGRSARRVHYSRILWLLLIGLTHAYVLWHGDILVAYALCGMLLYLFRNLSPGKLLAVGLPVLSVASILYLLFGLSLPYWPEESLGEVLKFWRPTQETINHEVAAYTGGWLTQMTHRAPSSAYMETFVFLIRTGWRACGMMLIGMALFKWGVLTGERSSRFYWFMATIGLAAGMPIILYGVYHNFGAGWPLTSMFLGLQFNYWGSVGVALAYIALVMLVCKSSAWTWITAPLAAVGRMAFTNYLMQSVICTTVFYGHGFGLFGRVERSSQILIVFGIWILQLIVSPIWLRHFRFGPAEWLWRSLTYMRWQPMRIQ
jgi:uncharacterized protein